MPDPTLRGKRDQIVLEGDVPSPANPPSGCRFHTRCWKAQDVCTTDEPQLQLRPDGAGEHHSACHFAEPRAVVETTDVSGLMPDARFATTDVEELSDSGAGAAPGDRATAQRAEAMDPTAEGPQDNSRIVEDPTDRPR